MKEEEEIVTLIRQGQREAAFRKIYAYYPMTRRLVLNSGGDEEQARDVFQDAVIVLYRFLSDASRQFSANVSTILYSIARNIWYKQLRKQREVRLEEGYSDNLEHVVEEQLEEQGPMFNAEQVFSKLGEPCVSLLKRFYYDKQSMEYIAKHMNYSSAATAKAQKYKCVERAKKIFESIHSTFSKFNS